MPYYAIRISHSYSVVNRIVSSWATKVEKMVVYEHYGEGDSDRTAETQKVHCHLVLFNTRVDKKQLRNLSADAIGSENVKGNELMAFKEWKQDDYTKNDPVACIYMTKGHHDPKYLQGYTSIDAERWKKAWVKPSEHVKISNDEKLYNLFLDLWVKDHWQEEIYDFLEVKKAIWHYCKSTLGICVNQGFINKYNMLCRTFYSEQPCKHPGKETVEQIFKPII